MPNMFKLDDLVPFERQKKRKKSSTEDDFLTEQDAELEDLEDIPEEEAPKRKGLADRYKEHLGAIPTGDQYKPGVGTKLLGALVAGLSAADDRTKLTDAISGGQKIITHKRDTAMKEWETKGKGEEKLADLENMDHDNEHQDKRLDLDSDRFKLDIDRFDLDASDRNADNARADRQVDQDEEEFEQRKKEFGTRAAIDWYNAKTSRQNADSNTERAASDRMKAEGKLTPDKIKQRNIALDDAMMTINEIKTFLYDDPNNADPNNAKDKYGTLGAWDSGVGASEWAQGFGKDKEASTRLKALTGKLLSEYLYEKSGKTITESEMARLKQFLPNTWGANPKEFAKRLAEFERTITEIRNSGGDLPPGPPDTDALGSLYDKYMGVKK
jgi:hypothetical protein